MVAVCAHTASDAHRICGERVLGAIDFAFSETSLNDLQGRVLDAALAFYRPESKSDDDLRNLLTIDIRKCIERYGCTPAEYFWYGFDGKSDEQRSDYMLAIEAKSILNSYAPLEAYDYCDKLYLHQQLEPFFKRVLLDCGCDQSAAFNAVRSFAATHQRFVIKAVGANCGSGIWFVGLGSSVNASLDASLDASLSVSSDALSDASSDVSLEDVLAQIPQGTHLFVEEFLTQSEAQAQLNPASVNTVRVATFFDGHTVRFVYANQRMGRAGCALDNVSAGGIGAGICLETGVVETPGVDKFGGRYSVHPDNGCPITGHAVPQWNLLLNDVEAMALQLPFNTYVGWDLAHSDDKGWSLVEANFVPGFFVEQVAYDCGSRPRFLSLFENATPVHLG